MKPVLLASVTDAEAIALENAPEPLLLSQGRHVLHLYYRIDHAQWQLLDPEERLEQKTRCAELVRDIRATPDTQLLTFSVVTPKADLGFLLITPDLHQANYYEKRLALALGPGVLTPVYSYLSVTELSEYTTSDVDYARTLESEEKLAPESAEFAEKMTAFRERMVKYGHFRLYPSLPDWPVVCFYPMSKRRVPGQNWYGLDFARRKELMGSHARTGRTYSGKVLQLITGATGLDDGEWGVTLFSRSAEHVKNIVYEMRFDEVSASYADFGEFFIGLQLPLHELFGRVCL